MYTSFMTALVLFVKEIYWMLWNHSNISINFSENEKHDNTAIKRRLNKALNAKLEDVERKREKLVNLDKKIQKLPDGAERRKLIYQKQSTEDYNRKHRKSPIDEERALHESYQILIKVRNLPIFKSRRKIVLFDCELRSIAVLRMTLLLLLLAISISQILINNRSFQGRINIRSSYEIVMKSWFLISNIVDQDY